MTQTKDAEDKNISRYLMTRLSVPILWMTNERVSAEQQQLGCLNMFTLVSRDTRDSLVTPSVTLPHTSHCVTTYNATRRSIFPIFKCPLVSRDMLLHITQSVMLTSTSVTSVTFITCTIFISTKHLMIWPLVKDGMFEIFIYNSYAVEKHILDNKESNSQADNFGSREHGSETEETSGDLFTATLWSNCHPAEWEDAGKTRDRDVFTNIETSDHLSSPPALYPFVAQTPIQ